MDGKAYGFFNSLASKEVLETKLPDIRKYVETPKELEFCLIEGLDNVTGYDDRLMSLVQEAKQHDIRYVLEATYPGATNSITADRVADVLNWIYQSSLSEKVTEEKHYKGAVIYEEDGIYGFRE